MKRFARTALLAAVAALPATALSISARAESPNTGNLTLSGGADYVTAYFFRGYNQEDSRLIVQPWATIGAKLVDSDDFGMTAYVGTWLSLHEQPTAGDSTFYETDYYAGVDFTFGEEVPLTLGVIYNIYTYPGDAAADIGELGFKLGFDDTKYTEDAIGFALKPYVAAYFETYDNGGTEDAYLEIGITPTVYTFNEETDNAISIGVPIAAGFSLDDYYFDDEGDDTFFGFVSVGVTASYPLPVPEEYGAWSLNAGVQCLYLAADNLEDLNKDDEFKIIGKVGVSMAY